MNRGELQEFFPFGTGALCAVNCGAMEFRVPLRAWVLDELYPTFWRRYAPEGLDRWLTRWECRDFASAFRIMATECWALTAGGAPEDGIAVGEMWFIPNAADPRAGHALNPIITEHGLEFLEPQTGKLCPLTPEQFSSRYFVRF